MSKLAFITHPVYLEHKTGSYHPERPQRLSAIYTHMDKTGFFKKVELITPAVAEIKVIKEVHSSSYIQEVEQAIRCGQKILDQGDTVVSNKSFEAALFAVGAVKAGVDLLKSEEFDKIFCAVRPPGHHAEYNYAKGFCIFNNIAIAAKYAQKTGLADKILIIDWDVHHGNGTQHTFESDNSVFYYSIHRYPFYPGTGSESERGENDGLGFTLNRPLTGGCPEPDFLNAFEFDLEDIEKKFKPDLIMISAGFDAHRDDPLGGMNVTENGYARMTEKLVKLAWKYGSGKVLSILEGGYNLNALATSIETHLNVLLKH